MRVLGALVEMVALVHGLAGKVARQDADLSRQLKRSSSSAALNASEGGYLGQDEAGVAIERLENIVPVLWVWAWAWQAPSMCSTLGPVSHVRYRSRGRFGRRTVTAHFLEEVR